jgi:ribokinase
MFDFITIGSATRDLYLISKNIKKGPIPRGEVEPLIYFSLGSKIEIDDIYFTFGGGGTNTAVAFSRLGFKAAFLGRIGAYDQRGKEIKELLQKEKVDTSLIIKDRKNPTALSVLLLTPQGERTILVYRGASAYFHIKEIPWSKLKTRWFYITTLEGNLPLLKKIFKFAQAHKIKIAFNPGQKELDFPLSKLKPLLNQVEVLFLNRKEAAQLVHLPPVKENQIFKNLCLLLPGLVVITDGPRGAMVCDNEKKYIIKTHSVKVKDSTGAGDAFGAGFIAGWVKKKSIVYALQMGVENATSVIKHLGAKAGLLKRFCFRGLLPVKIINFPN